MSDELTGDEMVARYRERHAAAQELAATCHYKTCRAKVLLAPYASTGRMRTCERCQGLKHFYHVANLEQE